MNSKKRKGMGTASVGARTEGRQPTLNARTVRCPACGASLRYDRHAGAAVCAHCGNEFDPGALPAPESQLAAAVRDAAKVAAAGGAGPVGEAKGLSGEERFLARAPWVDHGGGALADGGGEPVPGDAPESALREVECTSCGARLVVDCTAAAVPECPYCGGAAVVQGLLSGGWEPDYIIPFSVGREQAEEAFRKHVRHFLVPLGFRRNAEVAHAVGMYVPFWLYDGEVSGKMAFDFVEKEYEYNGWFKDSETWIAVNRSENEVGQGFRRVPADASTKMPDEYMDAIEPYDLGDLRPYSPAYLAGYCAECRDLDAWQCADRAASRMAMSTMRKAHHEKEDSRTDMLGRMFKLCVPQSVHAKMSWSEVKCALLPVWMLHVEWKGEDYLLAMNGQTGRLVSKLPVNERRRYGTAIAVGAVTFPPAVIVWAACWLAYGWFLHEIFTGHVHLYGKGGLSVFVYPVLIAGFTASLFWLASTVPRLVVAWLLRRQRTAVEHTAADEWAVGDLSMHQTATEFVKRWPWRRSWGPWDTEDGRRGIRSYAESVMAVRNRYVVEMGVDSFKELRPGEAPKTLSADAASVVLSPSEALGSFTSRLARRTGMWNWRESLRNSEWRS